MQKQKQTRRDKHRQQVEDISQRIKFDRKPKKYMTSERTGFRPYPQYKPSGIEWLGDVPAHWKIQRGKTLFQAVDVRSQTGNEELLTVSAERGIVPRKSANVTMFKAESYVGYKLCWPGDLVINSLWAWAHALGISQYHGIVSSVYGVYRLLPQFKNYASFIHQLVRSIPFQWELQVRSKGIWVSRLLLTDEAFLGAPFPLPPLSEQTAIVRYLDHTDELIRRYVSSRERLIEQLEEYRQAVIHHAVTRGLDPDVRLKPSGVEWLGDVPAHWEMRRLKTLCSMKSGDGITAMSIEPTGEYPVYGGNGLRGYTSNYTHDGNYVLIGRQGALCGNIHIARGQFWASEHAVVASLSAGYVLEWFAAILDVMDLNQYSIAAAQPGLAVERVLNLSLPVPSLREQAHIARYIERETADIDIAIDRARREIELLGEYRTRLIADVVTGKVDVREVAAESPDEIK